MDEYSRPSITVLRVSVYEQKVFNATVFVRFRDINYTKQYKAYVAFDKSNHVGFCTPPPGCVFVWYRRAAGIAPIFSGYLYINVLWFRL